ncbi:MAG: chloride channel protein [Acidobacteria bacterium]|nr:chloride channel protein [Acidobacteriota bacterium]
MKLDSRSLVFRGALGLFERAHLFLKYTEHSYMVLVAIAIGLLGGLGAVGFRECIRLFQVVAWHTDKVTLDYIRQLPNWWKIASPAVGGLIVGAIIVRFAAEAKGHGVPEVMEAVALHGGRIRPRVVIAKLVASGVCIASGGSVGREGPIVQIGSAIASSIGQWLHVGERRMRTLVGCGAAAGIAATFNAPVAGALFAVEIILGDFGVTQFSPIVISSVTATVVSRHFLGDFPAFEVPAYSLVSANELFAYGALGIIAGLLAVVFVRALYGAEDLFDSLRIPAILKPALGGVLIGLIAIRYPEIFGVGYEAINEALTEDLAWHLLLMLVMVKIVAVSLTIGSGGSGGIFAPSLFIGAMAGGAVGTVVHSMWPELSGSPGAYSLVGMGAVVAAGTHAPITAIVMIFELTSDYKIILPLMISCIIATLFATRVQKASIYTLKLLRRGVDIRGGYSANVLAHLSVGDAMRSEYAEAGRAEKLMPVISRFVERPGDSVLVTDSDRRLLGVITIDDIRPLMTDPESVRGLVIAEDMMRTEGYPVFRPEDPLDEVMRRFGRYRFTAPVVDKGRVVGALWPQDVIEAYNSEILKRDMASTMAGSVGSGARRQALPGVRGMSMAEVEVPASFFGRSVGSLDIRKRFGVSLLLIKRTGDNGKQIIDELPHADSVFQEGDVVLVLGNEDRVSQFERTG